VSAEGTHRSANHLVPSEHFDSLAAGGGGPDVIQLLMKGERSRRLLLLRALLDAAAAEPDAQGPLPDIASMWNALIAVQDRAPTQFDAILMQPQIGMWIAHSLRRLHGTAYSQVPLWVDIGYVGNVVIATAARAGIAWRSVVPHCGGAVMLPTLGLAMLRDNEAYGIAEASVDAGNIQLRTRRDVIDVRPSGDSDVGGWRSLRKIRSRGDCELAVWLDDIDPYREIGEPIPPDRLSDVQVRRWQSLLDDAFTLLVRDDPQLAAAMSVGFLSIVPLPRTPSMPIRSASSGDSFASALISMPPDPTTLAVTLVHEFQHIKLGGLLHLVTLLRDDGEETFYAPWRDDPRPLSGLLQGIYAFLGVTNFWRLRRQSEDSMPRRDVAEFEFALWRDQTWHALRALRTNDGLTTNGRRFVAGMAARMDAWQAEPVAPRIAAAARTAAADHRIGWRIRHLRPEPGYVEEVARRLLHGGPAPMGHSPSSSVVADRDAPWSHRRIALARLRLADPDEFSRIGTGWSAVADAHQPDADLALASGDLRHAAAAYAEQLAADPDQPDAWTGLILAVGPDEPAGASLLSEPELLPAVYRVLRDSEAAADPGLIAKSLCGLALFPEGAHIGMGAMSHSARFPLTAAPVAG
jgi:HEXXH motif-containing protein